MTVLMTPDGQPFFCGTYFPKASLHGRPGFVDLCHAVDDAWRTRRPELLEQAGQLDRASRSHVAGRRRRLPGPEVIDGARDATARSATIADWGGFGAAPKFPQTMSLELLLRRHATTPGGDAEALAAVVDNA